MDLTAFSRTRIYSRSAPPGAVEQDIEALRQIDSYSEGKRKFWGTLRTISLVVAVALAVVGCMAANTGATPMSFLIAGAALVAGLVFHVIERRHRRLDLDNRRYEMTARLMRYLSADMQPGQPVRVSMDLRGTDDDSKFSGKGESNGWKIRYFRDPWLKLQGRFVDGTSFDIQFSQILQKRSKWKRSASGKYKHKTKEKGKAVAAVKLRVKPDKYPRLADVAEGAREAVQLPELTWLADLTVDENRLAMKCTVDGDWTEPAPGVVPGEASDVSGAPDGSRVIAMMLLSLYQVLNLAKAIDKRAQAA